MVPMPTYAIEKKGSCFMSEKTFSLEKVMQKAKKKKKTLSKFEMFFLGGGVV